METKKEIEKMIDELCQLDQAIQDGRKIEKTSLCKEAAEVLKAIFHIQDQEHKTIIRDESKIKTNEVEKKRSGKWIKTMKPLKKFYEKYGERVYVTGFGVGYSTDMPCILKIEQESIDKGLGDYFVYKYLELNDGSCIAQIDISCIILKTWPKKISCVDVTKEVDQMLEKNRCSLK